MTKAFSLIKIFFAVLLTTAMFSCNGNRVFEGYREIDPTGWHQDSAAVFTYAATDTAGVYDIIIEVDHDDSYRYQNFWMFVSSESPQGYDRIDTIECFLADNRGKWLSERSLSKYKMPVLYMHGIKFPTDGDYVFEVRQGLRDTVLSGVDGIGLIVKKIADGEE